MDQIRVRRAVPGDEANLIELLEELDRSQVEWRVFSPRPSYRADLITRYREVAADRDAIHVIAERGEAIVGMGVGIVHRPSCLSDELAVEVSSFVVREADRGQGIGTAILEEIARFARQRGVGHLDLRVFAANDQGVSFWVRHGFRPRIVQMVASTEDVGDPS